MKFSNQLQQIMQHFNLSTTELADKILVPKATISHLISERNKPSLEFIMKLHTHFPTLNLEWLIYGKEPFLLNELNEKSSAVSPTFPSEIQPKEIISNAEEIPQPEIVSENKIEKTPPIPENILSCPTETSKTIESIVVFYSDGSFKRYVQE